MAQPSESRGLPESLYEQIIMSLASGVIAVDQEGVIVLTNPAARMQLGVPEDLLYAGAKIATLPGLAHFGTLLEEIKTNGRPMARREISLDTSGGRRTVGMSAYPLQGPSDFNGAIFLFMDLSEIRRLEQAAELNRQLAQVGELTAGIVHELRNPISVISGMGELLARQLGEAPPFQRRALAIVKEASQVEQLIGQFLSFSRPFEIEKTHCSAEEVVDRARQLCQKLAHDKGVTIETAVSAACGQLELDSGKIAQALANLLRNGIEVSPSGTAVRLAAHEGNGEVVFCVQDSGTGIHLKPGEDPFTPFFSRKEGGTGLGLSIVHRIVTAHRGKIQYGNVESSGALFEIHIPQ